MLPMPRPVFAWTAVGIYAAVAGVALWFVRGALIDPTIEHLVFIAGFLVLSVLSCSIFLKATLAVGRGGATMGLRSTLLGDIGRVFVLFLCLVASLAVLATGIDPCRARMADCEASSPVLKPTIDL